MTFLGNTPEEWGAFYTPQATAELMVRLAAPKPGQRILEPAAGHGVFLDALLNYGIPAADITAWEIDPAVVAELKRNFPGVKIEQRDALLERSTLDFDLIIGNPPYLNKQSEYIRTHKSELKALYGRSIGSSETYAMFCALALDLLSESGKIAFLLSDTIRSLKSHERLRKRIIDEAPLTHLVSCPDNLFPNASVSTAILICDKGATGVNVSVLSAESEADYNNRFKSIPRKVYDRVDGSPFLLESPSGVIALFDQPGRLFDYVDGHIGMHTRDNAHALAALQGSRLAELFDSRRQKAGTYQVITAAESKQDRWRPYLKRGGDQDFFAEQVEFVDWTNSHKYVIPSGPLFGKEGLAVSGISKRLSVRLMPAGCYWDTNKVIGLVPKQKEDTYWLLGLLNSDLYSYLARKVISETASLQLSDLKKLPLPDIDPGTKADIARLAKACVAAKKKGKDGPRAELNATVSDALNLNSADRRAVRRWAQDSGAVSFDPAA